MVTQDRRESLGRWIANSLNLRDIVSLAILLTTITAGYATIQTRLTILETRQAEWQARYEKEVIPRGELALKLNRLDEKLDSSDKKLDAIDSKLNYYGPNSYVYRPYKGAKAGTVRKF
jgi:hypothetical protein